MTRSAAIALAVWAWGWAASAQDPIREFSWTELKKTAELPAGQLQPGSPSAPEEQLRIDNPSSEAKTVMLLDLKHPGVTSLQYAVEGTIRYDHVKAKSYLEMWSWFANGEAFFSRTLGESGPMRYIEGSSDWRPFSLPFFSDQRIGPPVRIVVNVVFGDGGTVYLHPLKLRQYRNSWWNDTTGGWIGGIGGSVLGLLGGLIGTLAGIGKGRPFVLALTAVVAIAGAVILLVGVVALVLQQPYAVYYPLLLAGILAAAIFGGLFPLIRRRYEQIELRKMAAMDVR
jgi:hypothetical protein